MSYKRCDSEEEALSVLEDFRNQPITQFCPLTKSTCNEDCVCFQEAHKASTASYTVYSHYCGNEMFFKEEYNVNCRQC